MLENLSHLLSINFIQCQVRSSDKQGLLERLEVTGSFNFQDLKDTVGAWKISNSHLLQKRVLIYSRHQEALPERIRCHNFKKVDKEHMGNPHRGR